MIKFNIKSEIGRMRESDRRRSTCKRCEFRHPIQKTCTKCGCPVEDLATDFERECPLPSGQKKW